MKNLQRSGGLAALYLAAAYLVGLVLFIVVLDYVNITDPAQKVALIVEQQMVIFATNLLMYVFFGIFLATLALALYERLKPAAPALMQVATAVGIIWAGSLVASGMISNAGLVPTATLYAVDPTQAALTWQGVEIVADGIGNGNGEILGGVWMLLVSLAALRSVGLPKGACILGLLTGAVGIISVLPGLTELVALFGLSQLVWYAWVGITLLRSNPDPATAPARPLQSQIPV
ncbi:MAG TPA: DUF4386 family protein [Anaerolineae bacterium]|nr:DUF4386 family protein [Anaerolineae bacterium]